MKALPSPAAGVPDELRRTSLGTAARIGILCGVFFFEKTLLNQFVDFHLAQAAEGFGGFIRFAQHWGFRFLVTTFGALAVFAYVRGGDRLRGADAAIKSTPLRIQWLIAHVPLICCLVPLSYFLYRDDAPAPFFLMVSLWSLVAAAAALSAAAVMAPLRIWRRAVASPGNLWAYASVVAALGVCATNLAQRLWEPTATLTFNLVHALLSPILPSLVANPITRTLSTPQFSVQVAEYCSGLEGVGLILAFCAAWLISFRRDYVFPQALLLVPAGIAAMFALNVVRIAILVLIMNAGYLDVALYGFHSQAGWIFFIAVACGLVLLSRRSAWLCHATEVGNVVETDNTTATFLVPLLSILAAGMVAHALSGSFEYFYPLRVVAGFLALTFFWKKLAALAWRYSWRGPAVGVAVFVVWFIAARFLLIPSQMPQRLAAMSPLLRGGWILCRVLGSVVLVPVAEELAYRGFLMRRLVQADYDALPYRSVTTIALLASAVLFGIAHGSMWAPGVLAGAAYGFLVIRSGQLGEAVVAHAVSNALIAASALMYGQWQLW